MSEHITKDKAEQILGYGKPHRYMNVSRDVIPRALVTVIAQAEQIERLQNAVNLMTHTSRLYLLEDLYEDQVLTTQDMEKNND